MISDIFAKIQVFVDYWLSTPKENHSSNCNIISPFKIVRSPSISATDTSTKTAVRKISPSRRALPQIFFFWSHAYTWARTWQRKFPAQPQNISFWPPIKFIISVSHKISSIRANTLTRTRKNSPTGKFSLPSSLKSQKCPLLSKILTFRQKTNFSEKFPWQAKFNRYDWFSTIYQKLNPPRI